MSEYCPSGKKKARDRTFTTKPNSKITPISSIITSYQYRLATCT